MPNKISVRRTTLPRSLAGKTPCSMRRERAYAIATPTMKRKKGNIKSVGVHPCQGACRSGE